MRNRSPEIILIAESGNSGGIGRYCLDVCAQLGDRGALLCLCPTTGKCNRTCWLSRNAARAGVRFLTVEMPPRDAGRGYRQVRSLLKTLDYPILHVNGTRGNTLAMIAGVEYPSVRFLQTVHGLLSSTHRHSTLYRGIDFAACRRANRVIAVSAETRRRLTRAGVGVSKTCLIPNALPAARLERLAGPLRPGPHESKPRRTTVGFLGRLSPEKGIMDFGRLATTLAAENPATVFQVAGDGPCTTEFSAACRPLTARGRMKLFGEIEDPADFLRATDVLVMPSKSEGMPYALLEAMAAGCAVVAYGVGGIPEVIKHPGLGRLPAPGRRDRLINSVRELLLTPAEIPTIGISAAAHVRANHLLEDHMPALRKEYDACRAH